MLASNSIGSLRVNLVLMVESSSFAVTSAESLPWSRRYLPSSESRASSGGVLRDAAGLELHVLQQVFLPRLEVAVVDRGALDVDAADVEHHRRGLLFRLLLRRFGRRLLRRVALGQVGEVEAAILALDDVRLEAGELDRVDDVLPVQEGHQLHRRVRVFEGDEVLARALLREAHPRDLGAEARPERHLDVALDGEGAAGLFLGEALDVALVAIGVEGEREDRD